MRRQFFDSAASGWEDRNYPDEIRQKLEKLLESVIIPVGGTILDVGTGQGILLPFLRKKAGFEAKLIAMDLSLPMLQCAGKKDPSVIPLLARAEKIPLENDYVDLIVCQAAFPHFEDQKTAVKEFHRVLKKGAGAYVLHLMSSHQIKHHHSCHQAVINDVLPQREQMLEMWTEAGFGQLKLEDEPGRYFFYGQKL
ncbi:MAG: class I SAM-dependent methyltransferase [Deltaproteobacteria bacterium]|jgi:ubiquinone/menaquinone biosynthesis C-methylase UbiE|nr:class I SAM-dependent methyltransferase [Deltaproteobacteria bacterium]